MRYPYEKKTLSVGYRQRLFLVQYALPQSSFSGAGWLSIE